MKSDKMVKDCYHLSEAGFWMSAAFGCIAFGYAIITQDIFPKVGGIELVYAGALLYLFALYNYARYHWLPDLTEVMKMCWKLIKKNLAMGFWIIVVGVIVSVAYCFALVGLQIQPNSTPAYLAFTSSIFGGVMAMASWAIYDRYSRNPN